MTRPSRRAVRTWLPTLTACLFFIFSVRPASAQKDADDIPNVTRAWAITGATIVQAPGRVIENGTVVLRGGVIEAVGQNVSIPYDARIIEGDTLTIYAGLIDALSLAGVPSPNQGQGGGGGPFGGGQQVEDRSNPTFDQAGIEPQKDVRTVIDPEDDSVDGYRKLGFTTVQAVPRGQMLPGQAAIILLTGEQAADMAYQGETGVFFQFSGARGVYPGTPMGIMAEVRQLYREAERREKLETMYAADPTGINRPPYDAVHSAFFPVIDGDKPMIVFTDDALEIHRALSLSNELGFNMVLTGLAETFDSVDKVAATHLPVALTMDIPDEADWMEDAEADSLQYLLDNYDPDTRTATYRDTEAEVRNLRARQIMSRNRYLELPKMYADAGVPFAFTSMGVGAGDIREALRMYIEHGLSDIDALAALTTNAAAFLGVSSTMGTVESGKMANLVITDGDLFGEKTNVLHVFVDGDHYEYEPQPARAGRGNGSGGRGGPPSAPGMNTHSDAN